MPLGLQLADTAIGAGMGLLLEKHNDRRQLNMQQKLQNMQIAGQQQMTEYNMQKQFEMWQKTNYPAQMQELKKAGLNPGLMYGMGGGGGTTANVSSGSVTGGQAHGTSGDAMAAAGMGLQLKLLQAQTDLTKAQADKTTAEIPNVEKTGKNIEASTSSITQGVSNQKAQEVLTKIQSEIAGIQLQFDKDTLNLRETEVNYAVSKMNEEISILETQKLLDRNTRQNKEQLLRLELANKAADTWLKGAETANVNQDTKNKVQQVKMMIEQNMREWDKMVQTNRVISNEELKMWDVPGDLPTGFRDLLNNILIIPKIGGQK